MPTKQSIHNFTKGMVFDTDKSIADPNTYRYAENFRYLADGLGNSGVLYVPDASSVLISDFEDDEKIIGHCVIRDYLVLFTYIDAVVPNDIRRIRRYELSNKTLINGVLLYLGDSSGDTAFSKTETLSTVGRYESEDIIKVYWATKGYPIRSANIAEYLTTDGLVKSGSNSYLDINRFDLITNFNVVPTGVDLIELEDIISGGLQTGRIQYAISLLKKNGQETSISYITTSPINIFNDTLTVVPSARISGDSETITTNKGIGLNINLDADDVEYFDKYRLYRIHYKEYGQVPEITIVNDFIISGESNSCVDSGGVGLGTYSSEEFSVLSSIQYEAYEINEKDNRLIAANLVEQTWDVDWDARAYRFTSSGGTRQANLYSEYDNYGSPDYVIDGFTHIVADVLNGTFITMADIPETHSCLNAFNDIENDGTVGYQYMYQSDGANRGAKGPNVTITCNSPLVSGFILDSSTYQTTSSTTFSSTSSYLYPSSTITDYSYPVVAKQRLGYQRDEVYRFAIVLINNKGQRSTPKWSCDFRFPTSIATGISSYGILSVGANLSASVLGINVTVSNLPSDVVAWELVRVPREESDKTVIRAGAVIGTRNETSTFTSRLHTPTFAENLSYSNNQVVNFITPENIYNNESVIEAGDYLDIVEASDTTLTFEQSSGSRVRGYKFPSYDAYTDYTNKRYQIEQSEFITPAYTNTEENDYYFDNAENGIYRGWVWSGSTALQSSHGRSDVFNLDSPISNTLNLHTVGIGYGYVKRNSIGRYGGYTYSDRINNTYISCGKSTSSTSSVAFYGGDTYINYFNYMYSMLTDYTNGDTVSLLFPVESTLNLNLAHGALISKNHENFFTLSSGKFLTREEAGAYNVSGYTFVQDRDLYLYNTVYSQEQNIKKDVGYYDADQSSDYDTRVAYSDYKLDSETIDSWTKFRPINYIDVTGTYGSINKLLKYNNNLYFLQDNALGILPINQRSLIQDNNLGSLLLGSGEVLDRYDYINVFHGTQNKESADVIDSGIYFINANRRSLLKFNTNGLSNLGNTKGLRSYFLNNEPETIPILSGNDNNNELYIYYKDNILVYNTLSDNFISFYTYEPTYIGNTDLFHFYQLDSDDNIYGLYLDNDKRARWDSTNYEDSYITVIDNSEFLKTKVYDNLKFYTNHVDGNIDSYDTTFDTISFKNDYQTTGDISLVVGTNLERKEREFSMAIPRNIVTSNEKTAVDIDLVGNQNTARTFKERMRDKYIETTLTFSNDSNKSNSRFSATYLIFNYRTSSR